MASGNLMMECELWELCRISRVCSTFCELVEAVQVLYYGLICKTLYFNYVLIKNRHTNYVIQ